MRLLLDSHALFWWVSGSSRLSATARQAILGAGNEILVSVVSYYELGLKQVRGQLPGNPYELRQAVDDDGFRELPIEASHVVTASQLDWRHRDHWDRILAAQLRHERAVLVSVDAVFDQAGIERVW